MKSLGSISLDDNANHQELSEILSGSGIVLLRDVKSTDQLLELASSLGTLWRHRDADARAVTTLYDRGLTGTNMRGFTSSALPLHTDASNVAEPPALIFMWFETSTTEGGETLLCDARAAYEELRTEDALWIERMENPEFQTI